MKRFLTWLLLAATIGLAPQQFAGAFSASKFLSPKAVPHTYATFDSGFKSTSITLSGGNLTEAGSSSPGGFVASTIGKSTGVWWGEFTVTTAGECVIAIVTSAANPELYPGDSNKGYGYYRGDGHIYYDIAGSPSQTAYGATYTSGDVINIKLDMDAGTLVFYKNGTSQGTAATGLTGTWYMASGSGGTGTMSVTANFGASAFTYSPPGGVNAGLYN